MADELIIFSMVAISCFLMGLVVHAVLLQKNTQQNNSVVYAQEFNNKPVAKTVAQPKQPLLTTMCHKCNRKYQFQKNPIGKTRVECPFCHAKGIIG